MILFKCVISICLIHLTVSGNTQNTLDSKTRNQILDNVCKLLNENYVDPEIADKICKLILNKKKLAIYNKIIDPIKFGDILTKDMHEVYHDKHLYIEYNPKVVNEIAKDIDDSNVVDDPLRKIKNENFGFKKIEILSGNLGYLNLERFWVDPVIGKEIAKAAFNFLKHTHSIIIDLRTNGGGSPQAVSMLCSYFFANKLHMNSTYDRTDNSTTEFWTDPDSTLKEFWNKPLYLLTSNKTFSAAEEFAYDLQARKRAVIIGEITGGGAHNTLTAFAGYGFVFYIPYGKAINPVTKTNWEGTGVIPEFNVSADKALDFAQMKIFEKIIAECSDSAELFDLNWQFDILKGQINKINLEEEVLKKYEGVYGERVISLENGLLYYKRSDKPKFVLEPMTSTVMKPIGNNYFKVEFINDNSEGVQKIRVHYRDGRIEDANRN